MTKLIKKFLGGGTADEIYRASYSLPEIKITDKLPEWFKYLNDYDKARLKSGLINAETAKSIALKRATGTSQYMQDVNKLSWIPNGAMTLAGGMALAGAPQAARILGDAVFTADVLRAAEEKGMKQAVKENVPYLLLSGVSPLFKIGKFFGLGTKGVKVAGEATGKAVKTAAKATVKGVKKAGKDTAAGFREGIGKPPKQEVSEVTPNNSTLTTIEKFEKWPKKWFKEKKVTTTPEVPGSPAVEATPTKVYNSKTKEWESVPEGIRVEPYTLRGKNYFKLIAPDGTLYGKYLETAYKAGTEGKPAVETIPAVYKESEKLKPWVKWTTGLTTVGVATPYIINSIKTENSSQLNTPLQLQQVNNQQQLEPEYFSIKDAEKMVEDSWNE